MCDFVTPDDVLCWVRFVLTDSNWFRLVNLLLNQLLGRQKGPARSLRDEARHAEEGQRREGKEGGWGL